MSQIYEWLTQLCVCGHTRGWHFRGPVSARLEPRSAERLQVDCQHHLCRCSGFVLARAPLVRR